MYTLIIIAFVGTLQGVGGTSIVVPNISYQECAQQAKQIMSNIKDKDAASVTTSCILQEDK